MPSHRSETSLQRGDGPRPKLISSSPRCRPRAKWHIAGVTRGVADDLPQLHVLVVDDDDVERADLAALVLGLGCHVDISNDGATAVRDVEKLKPDVVLMDLGMQVMDGWNAIRRIREVPTNRRPYVIAFSGFSGARERERAFEAGCNEYIVKPLDVRGALRAYVARRGDRSLAPVSNAVDSR